MKKTIFSTIFVAMFCFSFAVNGAVQKTSSVKEKASEKFTNAKAMFGFGKSTDASASFGDEFGRNYKSEFSDISKASTNLKNALSALGKQLGDACGLCGENSNTISKWFTTTGQNLQKEAELTKNISDAQRKSLLLNYPKFSEFRVEGSDFSAIFQAIRDKNVSKNPLVLKSKKKWEDAKRAEALAKQDYEKAQHSAIKSITAAETQIDETIENTQTKVTDIIEKIEGLKGKSRTKGEDMHGHAASNDKHLQTIGTAHIVVDKAGELLEYISSELKSMKEMLTGTEN